MIKTITTTDGLNTIVFGKFYKYFWIKNKCDTAVNVSACATIAAGADDTAEIAAGEIVLIENSDNYNCYVLGAGTLEIHAQNFIECPFENTAAVDNGGSGGNLEFLGKTTVGFDAGVAQKTAVLLATNGVSQYKMLIANLPYENCHVRISDTKSSISFYDVGKCGHLKIIVRTDKDGYFNFVRSISDETATPIVELWGIK